MNKRIDRIAARGLALIPVIGLVAVLAVPIAADRPDKPAQVADKPIHAAVEVEATRKVAHAWTDAEEVMLAKLIYNEARGVESKAQQAAVVWCVLNRLDNGSWGDTITDVVTYPAQFAYWGETPVELEYLNLAGDVLSRWETEQAGEATVGRTLPREYLYFGAEGGVNWFRTEYDSFDGLWDWGLPDPYAETE